MSEDEDRPDTEIIGVRPYDEHDILIAMRLNVIYENVKGEKIANLVITREDLAKIMEARW